MSYSIQESEEDMNMEKKPFKYFVWEKYPLISNAIHMTRMYRICKAIFQRLYNSKANKRARQ